MAERLVADVIVERLQAWGVDRIFGYSGDGINTVLGCPPPVRVPGVRAGPA